MRFKLITILLLSHSLLAQAVEPESSAHPQNQQVATVKNDTPISDDSLDVSEFTEPQEDELDAKDTQKPITSYLQKAYDEIVSVIPKFGNAESSTAQHDEKEKADNIKNSVVLKFASMPRMRSAIVLIYDENGNKALHSKNADVVAPIASITKLMTAMVVLDAKLPLDDEISISTEDINRQKRTRSKTRTGMTLTRGELLKLALMASDNLSAAALARTYPGGTEAALQQMNAKARELGMKSTRFLDPTGLNSGNVSTANDLVKMVRAARSYELIQRFTTSTTHTLELAGHRQMQFHNTNPLVRNASWDIGLSKTGYISEAGRCLVMEAKITEHPVIIVLLDSWGRNSRVGDANRVKKWMESASLRGARESKEM
jgi:D-alanyl-D-alanine endopeptidase (penicillin-binding protein 7)